MLPAGHRLPLSVPVRSRVILVQLNEMLFMRILNYILALMFLVFAFVQVNDPDPILWILIYGAMAVTAILAAFEFYATKFLVALLALYVLYSLVYIPGIMEWLQTDDKAALFDNVAKMEHLYIEEAREFLGLLICDIVLIFYLIQSQRVKKTETKGKLR